MKIQAKSNSTPKCRRPQPRGADARFLKVQPAVTTEQMAETMRALYAWRDERRLYAQQLAQAKRVERFGGLRSIIIFTLMSSALVSMLVAGTMGG